MGTAARESRQHADVALQAARKRALAMRAEIALGRDPAAELEAQRQARIAAAKGEAARQQREHRTLGAVIRLYHEHEVEPAAFTDKYKAQWIAPFENHLRSYDDGRLWHRPVDEVEPGHLLDWLKALQRQLPHTARKTRQRLDAVYEWVALKKWAPGNPCKAIVRAVRRGAPSLENVSRRALPYARVPEFMARLSANDSTAAAATRFLILTAARTCEVTEARWTEFDLAAGVWLVPNARTKQREPHRVDLSPAALAIIEEQRGASDDWVFPSPLAMAKGCRTCHCCSYSIALGYREATTVHGFRASFSTWAYETEAARPAVIEAALGHRESDLVAAAYNRAEFLDERRKLYRCWAEYCESAGHVVKLPRSIDAVGA